MSSISQLTNLCTGNRTIAGHHPFRCLFGCVLLFIGCFENNVLFENSAQIYLINLHWKLGLGLKLRLRVALF